VQLSEKAWFLYVLRCADDTFYTGTTTDITRRINEHNTKKCGAKYTKTRRPVELIFWLDFENRSQAQKAEYKFKKLTRTQKEKIINASG
jgi:putative endonuclease